MSDPFVVPNPVVTSVISAPTEAELDIILADLATKFNPALYKVELSHEEGGLWQASITKL